MKKLLTLAAVAEAATGAALVVVPSLVVQLLFGADIAGASVVMSRITGIALIALGVGCWPGSTALCGMLTYSALATLYLAYIGFSGKWVGKLLWPAVVFHAVLTLLLARAWFQLRKPDQLNQHKDL
jgi:hypothetical protein